MRLNTPAPSYWKNCAWSLQAAGSAGYFPQFRLGAPRACGPLKFRIAFVKLADVMWAGPSWFISLAVVRIWPQATITQASDESFGCPTAFRPLMNGATAGSVLSAPSDDAMP